MGIPILCLVLGLLTYRVESAFTVTYACDTNQKITFSAEGTTALKNVHAANKGTTCGTGAAADKKQFTLTTDGKVTNAEVVATADQDNCDYANDANNVRTLTLILSTTDQVTIDSGRAVLKCTQGQGKSETILSVASGSVDGEPTGETNVKIPGDPTLKIVQKVTSAAVAVSADQPNKFNLGEEIRIVGYIDSTTTAKTLLLTSCNAKPSGASADTPGFKVIDASGCADPSDNVFAAKAPPVKDDVSVTGKYVLMGPEFKAFKTSSTNAVEFSCTVVVCLAGENSCDPPTCVSKKRRRRAVSPRGQNNGTLSSTVIIVTSRGPHHTDIGLQRHKDATLSNCLSHVSFISVVAILAVLLVVSLAVSVFFCSKLIRQNNNNQQKEAYPNPAYKA